MYEAIFKRVFDVFAAITLLICAAPLLIVLYPLVKFDSPGPFIFSTKRVGRHMKLFTFYKIRTMEESAGIIANDESQPYVTTAANDVRITHIGRTLRKFHLDELPQLVNVLIGDMSLIGVRPDAPSQQGDYKSYVWKNRHLARPGITGLAQVHSGDLDFCFALRNKYDLYYAVSRDKFVLDVFIVWQTILKVLKGDSF